MKRQTIEMVKRSVVVRALGAAHRGFGGSKTILYIIYNNIIYTVKI